MITRDVSIFMLLMTRVRDRGGDWDCRGGVVVINRNFSIILTFVLLVIGAGLFFLFNDTTHKKKKKYLALLKEEGYFIPLKIYGYCPANLPFVEVKIGDRLFPAIVDLGSNVSVSLPFNLIDEIGEKKWVEQGHSYGMIGRTHANNVYEVEKIKIQKMSFSSVKIKEKSLESMNEGILKGQYRSEYYHGIIGWELFDQYNLLVDCRQYILALCDSVETLRRKKYPVDSFTEVSLIPHQLLVIKVETEKGPLNCMLDTGSTLNMFNKNSNNRFIDQHHIDAKNDELAFLCLGNEDSFVFDPEDTQGFSSFKIEDREFGPISFVNINTSLEVDAILGMEFFDSHLVFIDFENQKVYLSPYPKEAWPKQNLRPTIGPMQFHDL